MAKLKFTLIKTGEETVIDYAGTREEYIAEEFGVGGLNPAWGTVEAIEEAPVAEEKPKKAVKKTAADE